MLDQSPRSISLLKMAWEMTIEAKVKLLRVIPKFAVTNLKKSFAHYIDPYAACTGSPSDH